MVSRIRALVSRIVQGAQGAAERHKLWAAIGIVLALFAVLIYVPKLSFVQPAGNLTPTERAKAESDLRGHLLQALGGLALIVGAYFTGRTFGLNREGQTSERFTHAVEQLANKELDIRLGGIYTLGRIANVSKTHYEPALEVLTAFLREHARWQPDSGAARGSAPVPTEDAPCEPKPRPRADFQAAATVLGKRDRRHEPDEGYCLVLRGVDLRGARLREADLRDARLEDAHLECADLRLAKLQEAHLQGTHLEGARLELARLDRTRMEGAILFGARLDGASFSLASLEGANLKGAIGLTQDQLARALTNSDTTLPEYFPREAAE